MISMVRNSLDCPPRLSQETSMLRASEASHGAHRSRQMREIRTFELDRHDVPTGWFIDRPQTLKVTHGQIWLTVEGETGDIWLRAGESSNCSPIRPSGSARPRGRPFFDGVGLGAAQALGRARDRVVCPSSVGYPGHGVVDGAIREKKTRPRPGSMYPALISSAVTCKASVDLRCGAANAARTAESRRACSNPLRSAYRYAAAPLRVARCRPCERITSVTSCCGLMLSVRPRCRTFLRP